MTDRDYRDLKREVWDTGRCSGCGACVAVCPADACYLRPGSNQPEHSGYCKEATDGVPCGACVAACPRMEESPSTILLGEYTDRISARAGFEVAGRQSGGAVTAILAHALEHHLIDAVVTVTEDRWTHRPSSTIITSREALVQEAGSRYNWWVPLLGALKEAVITRKYQNVAIVGVPCVVEALHRIRESDNPLLRPYARSVRLVIGLFCTESFDYHQLMEKILGEDRGIRPWQIRRLDVKGKLEVTLQDDRRFSIPLSELATAVRPGCRYCTDFTATGSDISAGAVGAPAGFTTLLIRTETGRGFVDRALQSGDLVQGKEIDLAPIERLARQKRSRQEEA